ncbi:MAG: hypothetical protein R2788_03715 [Saprospiraceae bacterium]
MKWVWIWVGEILSMDSDAPDCFVVSFIKIICTGRAMVASNKFYQTFRACFFLGKFHPIFDMVDDNSGTFNSIDFVVRIGMPLVLDKILRFSILPMSW